MIYVFGNVRIFKSVKSTLHEYLYFSFEMILTTLYFAISVPSTFFVRVFVEKRYMSIGWIPISKLHKMRDYLLGRIFQLTDLFLFSSDHSLYIYLYQLVHFWCHSDLLLILILRGFMSVYIILFQLSVLDG